MTTLKVTLTQPEATATVVGEKLEQKYGERFLLINTVMPTRTVFMAPAYRVVSVEDSDFVTTVEAPIGETPPTVEDNDPFALDPGPPAEDSE